MMHQQPSLVAMEYCITQEWSPHAAQKVQPGNHLADMCTDFSFVCFLLTFGHHWRMQREQTNEWMKNTCHVNICTPGHTVSQPSSSRVSVCPSLFFWCNFLVIIIRYCCYGCCHCWCHYEENMKQIKMFVSIAFYFVSFCKAVVIVVALGSLAAITIHPSIYATPLHCGLS